MRDILTHPATIASAGVIAGAVGGYFFAKKQLQSKFDQMLDEEMAHIRESYDKLIPAEKVHEFVAENEEALKIMEENGYFGESAAPTVEENNIRWAKEAAELQAKIEREADAIVEANQIADDEPDEDYDVEISEVTVTSQKSVDTSKPPFLISKDDFFEDSEYDEEIWGKTTLEYAPATRVLVDGMRPDAKLNVAEYVGVRNMMEFGKSREDPHVLYVRNNKLATDFEVLEVEG